MNEQKLPKNETLLSLVTIVTLIVGILSIQTQITGLATTVEHRLTKVETNYLNLKEQCR